MKNVCIRAPLSLVEELKGKGTNLSDITVTYWKSLSSSITVDPQQASVQSKIFEYIKEDPTIPYQYGRDDLRTERILKARLLADQIQSTESQISVAMVEWERMRS